MEWIEAIIQVLTDEGRAMHYDEITRMIFANRYQLGTWSKKKATHVNSVLTTNPDLFRHLDCGYFELKDSSIVADVCSSYSPGDSKYKCAAKFVKDSKVLSDLEKDLLELIVNFRIPLTVKRKVCFADILDKLEIEILDEKKIRPQSVDTVDAAILQKKLEELQQQLQKEGQKQDETLLSYIGELIELLIKASNGKVKLPSYTILGEFIPDKSNPKVVIYLKSIEESIKKRKEKNPRSIVESRWEVMAGVFIHEMFHAWNYFNARQWLRSIMEIDEPMVEFETLYFLKELETYTKTHSHSMHKNVLSVRETRESRVKWKQQSIGDVAAYGFGYYLYKKLSKSKKNPIIKSRNWIEVYSKKSASINGSYPLVEKEVVPVLKPVYPFKSEDKVMEWFKKIIFGGRATDISLPKLVLACIEKMGCKCFDAEELYAFAPIFEVCVPECIDLESVLKQQLDELVNDGFLEVLSDGRYRK